MCPKCKKKTTKWQLKFYNGICAECSIKIIKGNVHGAWSRAARLELQVHSKDVLQPKNKDGTVNKHFVEVYGTKPIEKEYNVSKQEVLKNAY
ncbi:MAG: hypothetical protein AAB706_00905 [Patescibacteria group bacterium]